MRQGPRRKRLVQHLDYCRACIHCRYKVFTEPFLSNKRDIHMYFLDNLILFTLCISTLANCVKAYTVT
jgi:hypothetical protein